MATQKQIEANRRNAKESTGPRTPEGKEKSRMNAISHGLCSRQVLLQEEDPDQFREVWMGVFEDLRPVGEVETYLACRVASGIWRMNRVARIEAQLFNESPQRTVKPEVTLGEIYRFSCLSGADPFGKLHRYETTVERGIQRALKELRTVQAARGAKEERIADEVSETLYRRRMEEALFNGGETGDRQAASSPPPVPPNGELRNEPDPALTRQPRPGAAASSGAEMRNEPNDPGDLSPASQRSAARRVSKGARGSTRPGNAPARAEKAKVRNEPNSVQNAGAAGAYGGNGTARPPEPAPAGK